MGLFPSAPVVNVYAPTTLFVGHPSVIDIEVIADDATKVEFIDVRLVGEQGWSVGASNSRVTEHILYPTLEARVMGAGVLAAGTTRFQTRFTLPPGTAPTHGRSPAWARTELRVHVSIPWWPDGRYRFVLPVRIPASSDVSRTPVLVRSKSSEQIADEPRLEVSLASARLVAGEVLVGACALFHVDDRKPRQVSLDLVPVLKLHRNGRWRSRDGETIGATLTLPPGSAGTSVPFRLELPASLTPSFTTVSHELGWWLVVKTGGLFRASLEVAVPLEIVDASAGATTARLTAAPRLADERIATLFDQFARDTSWRRTELDDQPAAVLERDDCELAIAYSYRGKDGTFLVAQLAYPTLGLGLMVTPSSAVRHVFFEDVEVGIAPWDRAHHVRARSPEQTIPLLRELVPVLRARDALGTLVRWTDDAIVFERPATAVGAADLRELAAALDQVAGAFVGAADRIPPPPGLAVDVAAWQSLAASLRGHVALGDLALRGELDQVPVELGLVFDHVGAPTALRASVGDPEAASAAARAIALALPNPAADVLASGAAEAVVDRLTRWPTEFRDLHVTDGVVSAALAITGTADASRARELIEALRALLAALDPGAGPYR